jgi:hypothetical protein
LGAHSYFILVTECAETEPNGLTVYAELRVPAAKQCPGCAVAVGTGEDPNLVRGGRAVRGCQPGLGAFTYHETTLSGDRLDRPITFGSLNPALGHKIEIYYSTRIPLAGFLKLL